MTNGTRETPVTLSPTEFENLRVLLERRGEVVTPDILAVATGENEALSRCQVVEEHVSRLPPKLR